ncbi:MAG: hypothetical protein EOO44_04125 [Flavobacterium sp.]|uniref:hypothetical protein n=1 Tax=Pedobacter agri TaxID=454586 RepID=UPI001220268E|nr:hypothetical protein [Pedobacter agri]MDQ1141879.1 hypothetical protein [Pedobacter agri]RZJ54665.1 MAG: hypothetical protein EOO44_04125 [Flavobacterium sp.]
MKKITLQISLAASDFKHAVHLLPHQIKILGSQADEILLTYDTHKSKGHFSKNWEADFNSMWNFLENLAAGDERITLVKIDYSADTMKKIASTYFKRKTIPAKDWRGGPFYTYFYGLHKAKNDYVFHIDSDLFFGGLSQTWSKEAIELYEKDTQILFINPLAGPPKEDGKLIGQTYFNYKNLPFFFGFDSMSTRLFLVDKARLKSYPLLNIRTKNVNELIRALVKGNPSFKLPEEIISDLMIKTKMIRVDFIGEAPGLWSLHPPYRTTQFYEDLPEIIKRIELNDVPASQKGFYDIVDEFVDWTVAKSNLKS